MVEILQYTIIAICQFITGIFNIEIEFFPGTKTKIGILMIAGACFGMVLGLICSLLLGSKGSDD